MLVTSELQQLYIGYIQSVPTSKGFFIDNTEALSMMLKGMDFYAEDLRREVSTLGEIKKKKEEKK